MSHRVERRSYKPNFSLPAISRNWIILGTEIRGRVLEEVLGLEDTFWRPWSRRSNPGSRSLKSSKIVLSSARGQHYLLSCQKFVERLKNFLENGFFWDRQKIFFEDLFFLWRTLALVSLASIGCVFGRAAFGLAIFFVFLASSLVSSTSLLIEI